LELIHAVGMSVYIVMELATFTWNFKQLLLICSQYVKQVCELYNTGC
jgi:hypothetical protein